jgi:hypothetical protein
MSYDGVRQISAKVNKKVFITFGSLYSIIIGTLLFAMIKEIEAGTILNARLDKLAVLNLTVSVTLLTFSISTSTLQRNMTFFWSFHVIFFGFNAVLLQMDPTPIYLARIYPEEISDETIFLVFLTTLVAGATQIYATEKNKNLTESRDSVEIEHKVQQRIFISTIFYLFTLPFLIIALGGFNYIFRKIRISSEIEYNSLAVKSIFESLLYVPPVILLLAMLFIPKKQRFNRIQILIRILSLILIILSNPFGNARQTTLFVTLPFIFYLLDKSKRIFSYIFFLALPLIICFTANLVNRYSGKLQTPTLTVLSRDGDFDSLTQLHNGMLVTSEYDLPILRQLLGSLFFFVPRSLWSGKPLDTGVEIANYLGLQFQNLSAPWILEAYVNARIPGVLIAAILVSYYLTKIDLNQRRGIREFVMVFTISGLLFILLRGSLLQASGRAIFAFILVQILFKIKEKRL